MSLSNDENRAPAGCTQWHYGSTTGSVQVGEDHLDNCFALLVVKIGSLFLPDFQL